MATIYQQSVGAAPVDPATSCPVQEVLPQTMPLQPAPAPAVPSQPQGTVYFAPCFVPNTVPPPFFVGPTNLPPPDSNVMDVPPNDYTGPVQEEGTEMVPPNAIMYSPTQFPIPFPPPMPPVPLYNPYVRPNTMFIIPAPFISPPVPGNPVPPPALPPPPPPVAPLQIASPKPTSTVQQSPAPLSALKKYPAWSTTAAGGAVQKGLMNGTPRESGTVSGNSSGIYSQTSHTSGYASGTQSGGNQTRFRFSGNNGYRNIPRDNFDRNEHMFWNRQGPSLNNYRTKLCINYKNGYCPYGDRCRFIHQPSDGVSKTTFSTNAPPFVPSANTARAEPSSPPVSVEMGTSNRLYSSTPVSLLGKSHGRGLDLKETPTTPADRRVSYRHDFNAGYRRPSVADGPHLLPTF